MFADLNLNLDAGIGDFESADALLQSLNSFVEHSHHIWSGITNEAPYQRLVDKLKELEAIRDAHRSKRPKTSASDILSDDLSCSDEEWFDAICTVMENSDFVDRFVKDTILKRRSPAKKTRKPYENQNRTKDLWQTVWGQMLRDDSIGVVGSWQNRKFRRRFRIPYSMFLEVVEECKEHNVFGIPIRKSKIAIEFKVLSCMKILGRDLCADEIDEKLNIGESTVNKFFKMFITNYAAAMYSKYVYVPEGEELNRVEEVFRHMGFPGCIGSMDVTHIFWDKCPEKLRFLCKGKEGKPSVAFQCVVEHTRRIQHISKPFYGATNDITITYQDTYPMKLLSKQIHADRVFQTYNREGDVTYWKGAYVLTDGGYPKCAMLIDPSSKDFDFFTVMWAEWLESIRKDVECVFGMLKNRFRWLRNKVPYHDIILIWNAMRVAAIFHNRLLAYDGYDRRSAILMTMNRRWRQLQQQQQLQ